MRHKIKMFLIIVYGIVLTIFAWTLAVSGVYVFFKNLF